MLLPKTALSVGDRHIPNCEPAAIDRRLRELLNLDTPPDPALLRRTQRLAGDYRNYARFVTPVWAPGAAITAEMRIQAEAWLPVAELASLLRAILRQRCRFAPEPVPLLAPLPLSWPDLLARLPFHLQQPDPTRLLVRLLASTESSLPLLFALFIPPRFGGGMGRYPGQLATVRGWLAAAAPSGRRLRLLDAACGSGEGTWELALTARSTGISPARLTIHGSSLGTMEIAAASHLFYPHDLRHLERMRLVMAPLFSEGYAERLRFFRDDLLHLAPVNLPYDLILCNGTIGGPFLHQPQQVTAALDGLTARLAPEGILCIADRFHGGWTKLVNRDSLAGSLRKRGLTVRCGEEGVVAIKPT
jgi:hypothetical protein